MIGLLKGSVILLKICHLVQPVQQRRLVYGRGDGVEEALRYLEG